MGPIYAKMSITIKVIGSVIKNMAKDFWHIMIEVHIRGISEKTTFMDTEHIFG